MARSISTDPAVVESVAAIGTALLAGAMAEVEQPERPIQLVLFDRGAPIWLHWVVPRPEDVTYTHPTRATAVHTMGGAYIDDFGTGIVEISLRGTTGYKMGFVAESGPTSGDALFFSLRNAIVEQYHQLRLEHARSGEDPEQVQLILNDTLNMAVWLAYPRQFQLQRSRQRPMLYQYVLSLWGVERLL